MDANKFRFSRVAFVAITAGMDARKQKNGARWLGRVGVSTATSPGGWKDAPLEEETRQGPGANLLARFQGLNLPRWISYPAIQVVTQGLVHGLGLRSARSAGFNTAAACV